MAQLHEIDATADRLREVFAGGRTRDLAWRERQLRGLLRLLEEREQELVDAFAYYFKSKLGYKGPVKRSGLYASPSPIEIADPAEL